MTLFDDLREAAWKDVRNTFVTDPHDTIIKMAPEVGLLHGYIKLLCERIEKLESESICPEYEEPAAEVGHYEPIPAAPETSERSQARMLSALCAINDLLQTHSGFTSPESLVGKVRVRLANDAQDKDALMKTVDVVAAHRDRLIGQVNDLDAKQVKTAEELRIAKINYDKASRERDEWRAHSMKADADALTSKSLLGADRELIDFVHKTAGTLMLFRNGGTYHLGLTKDGLTITTLIPELV